MRAWTFTSRGPPSQVLKLRDDLPEPQAADLQSGEVIVKVANVCLFGPSTRLMSVIPHFNDKHWIPNFEFSGTIIAVGSEDKHARLTVGDEVFGMISPRSWSKYNGVLAEYIVAPEDGIMKKPTNADFASAAGLSGGFSTVIGIAERTDLLEIRDTADGPRITSKAAGKRILVTGGSTATGMAMLQLAKDLVGEEGEVVTTASPRNRDAVLELGADTVVDYTAHPDLYQVLEERYAQKPFDVIVDITSSDRNLYPKSPAFLKADGYFVFAGNVGTTHSDPGTSVFSNVAWIVRMVTTVLGWAANSKWPVALGGVPRQTFFHSGKPTTRNMELVRQLVEQGKMKCVVDSVWDMDDALKAFDHLMTQKIRGKVIVRVTK